ncbi:hypothetical protein FB451DRAFT_439314 [Mycena latifolia]|nr:hypothetical protein FB451DRAFT_439314 [Mycena latifolia]
MRRLRHTCGRWEGFDGAWHNSSQFSGQAPVSITLIFTGVSVNSSAPKTTLTWITRNRHRCLLHPCQHSEQVQSPERISYFHSTVLDKNHIHIFPVPHIQPESSEHIGTGSGVTSACHAADSSGTLFLSDYARYTFENSVSTTTTIASKAATMVATTSATTTSTAQITTKTKDS